MKRFTGAALGAVFACALFPAHAAGTYSSTFTLDSMPDLGGAWGAEASTGANVFVREASGFDVHPVTGQPVPIWSNWPTPVRETGPSVPGGFGSVTERIDGPNAATQTTAGAHVTANQLSTHVEVRDVPAEGWGTTQWSRGFSLAAGASFTFSGIATLAITGDVSPLSALASVDDPDGPSWVRLLYQDSLGRAGFALETWLTGAPLADDTGVYDYSVGNDGRISLTITNTGNQTLTGGLHLSTSVQSDAATVAAPVPEPETWLMLLGGAALVGGAVRRRAAARPLATA